MKERTWVFLSEFGLFLGRKRGRFVVKEKGAKLAEFVADDVDSVFISSPGVALSADAVRLAVKRKVQVIFTSYSGRPYAIVMPITLTGSVRARREQFKAYEDERGFELARAFVAGKLSNQANLLKLMAKNRRDREPELAEELYSAGREISEIAREVKRMPPELVATARQSLMNAEADGARIYWSAIKRVIPAEMNFPGRVTRGARDPFNVMLNFGYMVALFPEVWKAVSYAGLDPYAGFLHADRPGKPSLVLDLMEEFRQQVVDRAVLAAVTLGMLKPSDIFDSAEPLGRKLSKGAVTILLDKLRERLDSLVMFGGRRSSIRGFIHAQARRVARFLVGKERAYRAFTLGW